MSRPRSRVPLASSLVAALFSAACIIHVSDDGHAGISFFGEGSGLSEQARREESHELHLAAGQKLTLEGSWGDVRVYANDSDTPELRATLDARGRSHEEAQAVLDRYHVEITETSDGVSARIVGEPLEVVDGSSHMNLAAGADFVVTIPERAALDVTVGAGDIETRGTLGDARLDTGVGDVYVEESRSDLAVETGAGDVTVARFDGQNLSLRTGVGDIRLDDARADTAECFSGAGDIEVWSVHAERASMTTGSGDIDARGAVGNVVAHSSSGDVHVAGVEGTLDASSGSGSVDAHGVLHGLTARSSSGDVTVHADAGSRVDSEWLLDSGSGDVLLRVPEGFDCRVHARTGSGEVECDLPVVVEAGQRKNDTHLLGQIGSGGGQVRLSSGSGDVALRRR
jgi:DUF4097 and DUF4098 domain-containing protein YvlB